MSDADHSGAAASLRKIHFKPFRAVYPRIIAPIILFGLSMIVLLTFLSHLGSKMTEQTNAMIDASMEIRSEISLFHLLLDEMLQGENQNSREQVWEHFDNAKWYANAMITGGRRDGAVFTPPDDQSIIAMVRAIDVDLNDIAEIAAGLEQDPIKRPRGSPADLEFDRHFNQVIEQSQLLEKALNRLVDRKIATHMLITFMLEGGVFIFTVIIAYLFIRYERQNDLAKAEIKESEEKFRSIYQSTHVAMIVAIDDIGGIVTWNPGAARAFGYDDGEIINHNITRLIPERYREAHVQGFRRATESGELRLAGKTIELYGLHKNGHEFPIELSLGKWKAQGRTYFSAVINDISERKRIESEIHKAREDAVKANNVKSEFLATMSHDLRTPLNAIMGFSELMRDQIFGPLGNPKYNEYAADIHKSGKTLISLINGVLDLSRIEAGKYRLVERPLDVALLIQDAVSLFHLEADKKKVRITGKAEANLPKLCADERAVGQILNNLLSNALKFTDRGGEVTISADVNDGLEFKVTDNGIGMSEQDIVKALQPFEQANSSQPRKHEGSGLGLYICCNLVGLHGGTLRVDSVEGRGTTVSVLFPMARINGAA